jgi:hypothetical protein
MLYLNHMTPMLAYMHMLLKYIFYLCIALEGVSLVNHVLFLSLFMWFS